MYDLVINSALDASLLASTSSAATQLAHYTSKTNTGGNNGAALKIEFDIPAFCYGDPAGFASIKVSGVNFADIRASKNLNGATLKLQGGMAKGLPLANPSQAGLLLAGTVQQAFGNWQGTEVSLELIVSPKVGTIDQPVNLAYTWAKGDTLEAMVRQVLGIAYPGSVITGQFDPRLIYTEDAPFFYQTMTQLAQFVLETSRAIITDKTYLGAQITPTAVGFRLFDGTEKPKAKEIRPVDMVGQPTWLDFGTLQFKVVLRADLSVGDIVKLPQGSNVINTAASFTQYRDTLAFQGEFQITGIRHLGDSRQPDANAWVTVVTCVVKS